MPLAHPRIQKKRLEEAVALVIKDAILGFPEALTLTTPDWDGDGVYFEVRITRAKIGGKVQVPDRR